MSADVAAARAALLAHWFDPAKPEPYIDALIAAVRAEERQLHEDCVAVVGHSLGCPHECDDCGRNDGTHNMEVEH